MTNLIDDREQPDYAHPFTDMARRIDKNRDEGFAGAFVIAPPVGESIENLFLNNSADPIIFWTNLKTMAEQAIDDLSQKQQQSGFPRGF